MVGQNLKNDLKILNHYRISMHNKLWDNMLASYVLHNTSSRHDLNTLAVKYLSYKVLPYEEVAGKGSKQLSFNQVAIENAAFFAAENADVALRLYAVLSKEINANPNLRKVLEEIELPLLPILAQMEYQGVLIDIQMLQKHSQNLQERIKDLEKQVHEISGEVFNLSSPKQLQKILFTKLKIAYIEKNAEGPSFYG